MRSFLVAGKLSGVILHVLNRHTAFIEACCIIKTTTRSIIFNNAACFRFNNAACRFSTCKITPIISLPPKKTAPVFLTQLVCIIFLSAFGDIMQTENNGFG